MGDAAAVGGRVVANRDRRDLWIASGLALAGAAWGAIGIGNPSIWADEGATVTATQRGWGELWHLLQHIDAVHGLYYAGMKPWLDAVGVGAVALRLPSLLAMAVTIAATYLLARTWLGVGSAVVAAAACGLLPRSTWMAVEGRSWAIGTCVAVVATLLLLSWCRRRRWPLLAGYALAVAVGTALNIYFVFLIAAHALALVVSVGWRRLAAWLPAAVVGTAAAAPVVIAGIGQRAQLGDRGEFSVLGWATGVFAKQFVIGDSPGDAPGLVPHWLWSGSAVALAVGCWGLLALAVLQAIRRRGADAREPLAWVLSWVLVPPLLVLLLGLAGFNVYHPRYFGFATPAFAICLAMGLAAVRPVVLRRALAVGLILLTVPVHLSQRGTFAKAGYDWSVVAQQVADSAAPGDGVYFADSPPTRTMAASFPAEFAGLVDLTIVQTPAEEGSLDGSSAPLSPEVLAGAPDRVIGIWSTRTTSARADRDLFEAAGYHQVQQWSGPQTAVVVWDRPQ